MDVLPEKLNGSPTCDCDDCRKKQDTAQKAGVKDHKPQLNGNDNRYVFYRL